MTPTRFALFSVPALTLFLVSCADPGLSPQFTGSTETVGASGPGRYVTPVNQILTPAGRQVALPGLRPQVIALSPNGKILVTTGKTNHLAVIDPVSGSVVSWVPLPPDSMTNRESDAVSTHILKPDKGAQVSFTGLIFSSDGRRLYLADVNGSIKVFAVDEGGMVRPLSSLMLPHVNAPGRKSEIPSGLAVSGDGHRLYVALNLSNRLGEFDTTTGKLLRQWEVGVAPYDVVIVRNKAYVSNWGGRRPDAQSLTGPAGRETRVRVDPVRHIASEGSVTVIDLAANRVVSEILTGLHASALAAAPNGRHVVVANAGSDTLSVIQTSTDKVVETIWARSSPDALFGASPNALAFNRAGDRLYVCNGTQNAVAFFDFDAGESRWLGLAPVGWYPGAIVHDERRKALYVANIKGTGSGPAPEAGKPAKFNTHQYHGTVSLLPLPDRRELARLTAQVFDNYRRPLLHAAALPARPGQPPCPVPERVGEPSVFQHVVYIIKENRTYDQVLGDVEAGNGDPSLCVFGEHVTPNQHKMVRDFVLLDNTYCSGILSADGHQWSDTAFATDYMEKSFAGFPRSYPDGMDDGDVDALAYSPAGFIWDKALAHGKTIRVYGEFAITDFSWKDKKRAGKPTFADHFRDFQEQTGLISISSRPAIESLRPHLNTNTVGWEMTISDVYRAAEFLKDLQQWEHDGVAPNFIIICLPNDHTSGTKAGSPTPGAHVADNDLAFGQIVEGLSHSRFWKETCVFAIEDDPQDGWDHVSGYRTTAYVISPYTKRGEVISTQYNQTSILRTIELILGLPPMNQMDATATPLFDCFTGVPDFTRFKAVANNIPLDQLNPAPAAIAHPLLRHYAKASERLPLEKIDQCPEDLLNRIIWHAMKGPVADYPKWAVRDNDE